LRIDLDERHHNSLGMAHGGVLLTLADVSMAMAASSQRRADEADSRVITIEMKTSFIGPGFGRLIASAVCVQRAGSIAFCETEVRDEKDRLVARASGTFKYVRAASTADSPTASAPRPTVTISESSST
jgi:uncharacterized protein (TIGR00369 family)